MKFRVAILLVPTCLLIFCWVFGRDFLEANIIVLAHVMALILGMLGGLAMGFWTVVGFVLGKRKSKRHLVIFLAGVTGMVVPCLLISSLFILLMLTIEALVGDDIYTLETVFYTVLILTMIPASGAAGPYVERRWGSKESGGESELPRPEKE